jgi:hypothetical protein
MEPTGSLPYSQQPVINSIKFTRPSVRPSYPVSSIVRPSTALRQPPPCITQSHVPQLSHQLTHFNVISKLDSGSHICSSHPPNQPTGAPKARPKCRSAIPTDEPYIAQTALLADRVGKLTWVGYKGALWRERGDVETTCETYAWVVQ